MSPNASPPTKALPPLHHHLPATTAPLPCCHPTPHHRPPLSSSKHPLTFFIGGKGGKGLGKGGAKRHRKILRDNIQGITKPAIRRLARRGGVKRISASKPTLIFPALPRVAFPPLNVFPFPHVALPMMLTVTRHSDLRGNPRCPQDLPRRRHPRRGHLHRAREEEDGDEFGCGLCAQASRAYALRFRWIDVHVCLQVVER